MISPISDGIYIVQTALIFEIDRPSHKRLLISWESVFSALFSYDDKSVKIFFIRGVYLDLILFAKTWQMQAGRSFPL